MRSGKKILVIDDSIWMIERLLYLLDDVNGISGIEYALNYKEALVSIEKNLPDILFLDINMPEVNGIQMLKKFRKKYPEMKIIMFSIHTNDFYRAYCKNLGADYFINKSEEFEQIPGLIAEIIKETEIPAL